MLATLLFVWALERGGVVRWGLYAVAAAALPLTHPLAASVLAAHGAALIALRERRPELRGVRASRLSSAVVAAVLLGWMAADRYGDADGAGSLTSAGWDTGSSTPSAGARCSLRGPWQGSSSSSASRQGGGRRWVGVLVAGLIVAPVAGDAARGDGHAGVHGRARPVRARDRARRWGRGPILARTRGLLWAGFALLAVGAAGTIGWRLTRPASEDWRALAAAVERVRQPSETVVVVPDGARAAFAYYAPGVHVIRFARGDGAWVAVVADTPSGAIAAARPVVRTPRYALLRQFRYGDGLRLQHWVRP